MPGALISGFAAASPEESIKLPELRTTEPGTPELGTTDLATDQTEKAIGALPPPHCYWLTDSERVSISQ